MERTGGGESGEMCSDFREVGKVECIFFYFFCEEIHKSVSQELCGDLLMVASWLAVCVTHRQVLAIIVWGHGGYPEFLL